MHASWEKNVWHLQVALSSMHRYLGDALDGPLAKEEVGTVVGYDCSVKPCLVRAASGEEWWYHRDAVMPVDQGNCCEGAVGA